MLKKFLVVFLIFFGIFGALVFLLKPKVHYKTYTETKKIAYKTIEKDNPDVWIGEEKTTQKGMNGTLTIYYKDKYVDEEFKERKKIREEITKKPIDEIIEVGTKKGHATGYVWEAEGNLRGIPLKAEIKINNIKLLSNEYYSLEVNLSVRNLGEKGEVGVVRSLAFGSREIRIFPKDRIVKSTINDSLSTGFASSLGAGYAEDRTAYSDYYEAIKTFSSKYHVSEKNPEGLCLAITDPLGTIIVYTDLSKFWEGPFSK